MSVPCHGRFVRKIRKRGREVVGQACRLQDTMSFSSKQGRITGHVVLPETPIARRSNQEVYQIKL